MRSDNTFYIISTDLDGTLLDHHTYSWKAAEPAINFLKSNEIPIIFNTSKTLAEALQLQRDIHIEQTAIVENGSALAIPNSQLHLFNHLEHEHTFKQDNYTVINFGRDRQAILEFIQNQKILLGNILESYSDWPIETIMEKTGLTRDIAELSAQKTFSEPFIWRSDKSTYQRFYDNAIQAGFKILQGGRFHHLIGDTNKAKPLLWLKQHYKHSAKLICLGDNKNDVHMLNAADIPVCIKSPTSPYPEIEKNINTIYTEELGPAGWNKAISQIFHQSLK